MGQQKDTNYEGELPNLVFYFSMFSVSIVTNYFKIDLSMFLSFLFFFCIVLLGHFVLLKPCVRLKCYCFSVKFIISCFSGLKEKVCSLFIYVVLEGGN